MRESYYGLKVAVTAFGERWKWQVTLPFGAIVTSNQDYPTTTQALNQGIAWIAAEGVFNAIDNWLSELSSRDLIQPQEYSKLMSSLLQVTRHR
jgi:hypothetical protein